jgi:hypothetical protein
MQMKRLAGFGLLMMSALAQAGGLADVAGHYVYSDYAVTLPGGKTLDLAALGAANATLDIDPKGTITLRMTMKNGQQVEQSAHVSEAKFKGGSGYWVAQWPDMTYPVRAEITVTNGNLQSVTTFDEKSDVARYGTVERATLKKVNSP